MSPLMFDRVSQAMLRGNPELVERARVVKAVQGVASFDALPRSIRTIIIRWEKTPVAS